MELGEKLKQARLEAGLSQRQLCGEEITRNMLSLIENGSAKPSMKTLQYLAGRLGKSVSYFLEETAVLSPNQQIMASARQLYDDGNFAEADQLLESYRAPDPVYDREKEILWVLLRLELAKEAIRQERFLYAAELLKQMPVDVFYLAEDLHRRRLLLLGSIPGQKVADLLPSIDEELLLRAQETLADKDLSRAIHLLEAMDHRNSPKWHLLRGTVCLKQEQWSEAADHLQQAEAAFPKEACPLLETCWRELGDFRKAYEYACKQR
jgi:transcriptional regulator with XRE-family HTH domain